MFFIKEKNRTLLIFFLALTSSLFYYPSIANSETIVSEVTVEVYREPSIFKQAIQNVFPKTNEELSVFLTWIGLFLIIGFILLVYHFKNQKNLGN